MIDLEQLVEVQINRSNRKGYRNQGFDCDMGDIIQVKMKNLYRPANSIRIKVICENCGKEYSMLWSNYQTLLKQDDKRPFCKDCASIKEKEVIKNKYGVESLFQLKEYQDKAKKTCLEKYGEEYVTRTKDFQEKRNKTNLEKYRCISPLGNKEVIKKSKDTLKKNYGVDNPPQSKEIQEKIRESFSKNGTQKVSKQQQSLFDYLDRNEGFELNYPMSRFNIDIADTKNKIAIEYNGGRHNLQVKMGTLTQSEFIQKETYRKKILYSNNWKIITLISPYRSFIPDKDSFLSFKEVCYNYFEKENRHWVELYVEENNRVKTSMFEMPFADFVNKYLTVND